MSGLERRHVYCYDGQRLVVAHEVGDFLGSLDGGRRLEVHAVDQRNIDMLYGISHGVFVDIASHPDRVPEEVWHVVKAHGFVVWTFDDRWVRAHACSQ